MSEKQDPESREETPTAKTKQKKRGGLFCWLPWHCAAQHGSAQIQHNTAQASQPKE
jgi:hypothetical protein